MTRQQKIVLSGIFSIGIVFFACTSLSIIAMLISRDPSRDGCFSISNGEAYLHYYEDDNVEDWFPEKRKIVIKGADADSFENVFSINCRTAEGNYTYEFDAISKDKDHVYLGVNPVKGIDPQNFHVLQNKTYSNVNSYYANNRKVYYYDSESYQIIELDLNPSEVVVMDHGYIRDNSKVYYFNRETFSTNPRQFEVLNVEGVFAKDGNNIFIKENILKGIEDPQTWEWVSNLYSKDQSYVYFLPGTKLPTAVKIYDAQPESFQGANQIVGEYYKFNTYKDSLPYGKDQMNVYYENSKVPDVNPDYIVPINKYFWSDGDKVYFKTEVVEGAKLETFRVGEISTIVGKDTESGREFDMR
jgi:hypothetical protein